MLQLDNQTPFAPVFAVLPDHEGVDTLYVVVKATVNLRPKLSLAPAQSPPDLVDEYYEDPETSSLKRISNLHIGKPGSDALLVGCARPPQGRPAEGVMVAVSVAERKKEILVVGDRTWQRDGTPSPPQAFNAIPLVWERAFGGTHADDADRVFAEERNPIGIGFRGQQSPEQMVGTPVPNLEDVTALLRGWDETPPPACFAPISPSWLPRRQYAGTYDANWQQRRAPYLPADFDPRFLQCAPAELAFERYLQGGEAVHISGAAEDGPIEFMVPSVRPIVEVKVAGQIEEPWANLETLLFEPDENRASMIWRAALPCDRQVLKVEKIAVKLRRSGKAA
jgi:hypothetical protein